LKKQAVYEINRKKTFKHSRKLLNVRKYSWLEIESRLFTLNVPTIRGYIGTAAVFGTAVSAPGS
jgi:hypothetical protein